MALFAINTGLRQSNLCGLQWTWEITVPEIGRSVFVIPAEAFKTKRPHVVILNDVAWSIIKAQRGLHPIWVFPFRGKRTESRQTLIRFYADRVHAVVASPRPAVRRALRALKRRLDDI